MVCYTIVICSYIVRRHSPLAIKVLAGPYDLAGVTELYQIKVLLRTDLIKSFCT